MIELPKWLSAPEQRSIRDARAATANDPKAAFALEQVIGLLIRQMEYSRHISQERIAERDRLESIIVRLGGGNDRRGLNTEPRGIMVQHGIHTVIEDSR